MRIGWQAHVEAFDALEGAIIRWPATPQDRSLGLSSWRMRFVPRIALDLDRSIRPFDADSPSLRSLARWSGLSADLVDAISPRFAG